MIEMLKESKAEIVSLNERLWRAEKDIIMNERELERKR